MKKLTVSLTAVLLIVAFSVSLASAHCGHCGDEAEACCYSTGTYNCADDCNCDNHCDCVDDDKDGICDNCGMEFCVNGGECQGYCESDQSE